MQSERIHWIDIARGIGIIFVIYAHMLGSQDFRHLIYAFHMPLFFFLSGVVFNDKKYTSFWQFVKKNTKSILVPYFIFAFLMFFLWLIRSNISNIFSLQVLKQFLSIFYANSNNGFMIFNNLLWFLPALFVTKVIFGLMQNLLKKTEYVFVLLFLFSALSYLISILLPFIKLPLGIESAFTGVVFYGVGFLWFKSENAKKIIYKYKFLLFFILLVFGALLANIDFNNYGHQIDIRLNHLNNYFYFYLSAFSGIFAWISFSIILNKNRILEALGKNSLILFVWHPIVFIYFEMFLKTFFTMDFLKNIKLLIPLIYTTFSITVILLVNYCYLKLRLILGNKFIN